MAKTKTPRPPKEPKARQGHFPEMEPPKIDAIERAAEAYVDVRDEFDGQVVERVPGEEKIKVRKKKDEPDGDPDPDDSWADEDDEE